MAAKKSSQLESENLRQQEEIFGILLMTLALLVLISLVSYNPGEEPGGLRILQVENAMGVLGVYLSYYLIKLFIGYSSIVVPFLLFAWGWNRFKGNEISSLLRTTIFTLVLAVYIATILGLPHASNPEEYKFGFEFSGLVGGFFATILYEFFGKVGSIIILISLAMTTIIAATQFSLEKSISKSTEAISDAFSFLLKQFRKINITMPQRQRVKFHEKSEPPEKLKKNPPEINAPTRNFSQPENEDKIPLHKKLRQIGQDNSQAKEPNAPNPDQTKSGQTAIPSPPHSAPEFSPVKNLWSLENAQPD
jgi:S-DNA-T family DNA segregation ATPase FtsK/SpoIIIE